MTTSSQAVQSIAAMVNGFFTRTRNSDRKRANQCHGKKTTQKKTLSRSFQTNPIRHSKKTTWNEANTNQKAVELAVEKTYLSEHKGVARLSFKHKQNHEGEL
jgi:hypothetical protein